MLQLFLIGILSGITIGCICLGIAMLLLGRRIFRVFRQLSPDIERFNHIREAGERIVATVTDIQETVPTSIPPSYMLSARWQDPKTDHIYTLRTPLREPTLFAVGGSITFLIDPDNPEDHIAQFLVDKEKD